MIKRALEAILWVLIFQITGCATYPNVPPAIREASGDGVELAQVRMNPEAYLGVPMRWGGVILSIKNQADATWLEILQYRLDEVGQPLLDRPSGGRFFAQAPGFLDPEVYAPGREITVTGTLTEETITQRIGDHEYTYPVVNVDEHYLWPFDYGRPYGYRPYYYPPYGFHFGFGVHHEID